MSEARNIRDPEKFLETMWDWTPFNECFSPTRIKLTDIDGAVERKGRVLFIETKLPGQEIPLGQRIMYDVLSSLPYAHVLVIWGKPNAPVAYQWWGKPKHQGDLAAVKRAVRAWFEYANRQSTTLLELLVKEAQREFETIKPPQWGEVIEAPSPPTVAVTKEKAA